MVLLIQTEHPAPKAMDCQPTQTKHFVSRRVEETWAATVQEPRAVLVHGIAHYQCQHQPAIVIEAKHKCQTDRIAGLQMW